MPFPPRKAHTASPLVPTDYSHQSHTRDGSLETSKEENHSHFSAQFSVNRGDTEPKHDDTWRRAGPDNTQKHH